MEQNETTLTAEQVRTVIPYADDMMVNGIQAAGVNVGQLRAMTKVMPLDFEALVDHHQKKHGCSKTESLKFVAMEYPEAHAAFIRRSNNG